MKSTSVWLRVTAIVAEGPSRSTVKLHTGLGLIIHACHTCMDVTDCVRISSTVKLRSTEFTVAEVCMKECMNEYGCDCDSSGGQDRPKLPLNCCVLPERCQRDFPGMLGECNICYAAGTCFKGMHLTGCCARRHHWCALPVGQRWCFLVVTNRLAMHV